MAPSCFRTRVPPPHQHRRRSHPTHVCLHPHPIPRWTHPRISLRGLLPLPPPTTTRKPSCKLPPLIPRLPSRLPRQLCPPFPVSLPALLSRFRHRIPSQLFPWSCSLRLPVFSPPSTPRSFLSAPVVLPPPPPANRNPFNPFLRPHNLPMMLFPAPQLHPPRQTPPFLLFPPHLLCSPRQPAQQPPPSSSCLRLPNSLRRPPPIRFFRLLSPRPPRA